MESGMLEMLIELSVQDFKVLSSFLIAWKHFNEEEGMEQSDYLFFLLSAMLTAILRPFLCSMVWLS